MFLAWKEIIFDKKRFALVIGVLVLVSYLVYFLTGLAYGLAQLNRTSVDKWAADAVILSDTANVNINMSLLDSDDINDVVASEKALLGLTGAVVTSVSNPDEKINTFIFGIDSDAFISPSITEGKLFDKDFEIVLDDSVKEQYGIELGDELHTSMIDTPLTVVGFTNNAQYNASPVAYSSLTTYRAIRFMLEKDDQRLDESTQVNAIIARQTTAQSIDVSNNDLTVVSIQDYINEIPGYSAQVLTFGFMIIFLIVIASVVIGIFMYVLTVQKTRIFGIMKAQGISSAYIGRSVAWQTTVLSSLAVMLAIALTLITGWLLPVAVPFKINYPFLGAITVLIMLFSLVGSLFSVRTVTKIDPIDAIG